MSDVSQKVLEKALKAYPSTPGWDERITCMYRGGFIRGYQQAEKDVAEAFARIIRGNLSMIDPKVQTKFEQLYTDVTEEKMYKGFKD